jgi:hypothetical protein
MERSKRNIFEVEEINQLVCMKIFKTIILFLSVMFLCSCINKNKENSNVLIVNSSIDTLNISKELEKETLEIEMEYFGWACPCAQWITAENKEVFILKSESNIPFGDSLFYYIEPSSDTIAFPSELTNDFSAYRFKFTGNFYKKMQFMGWEGEMGPAITFRYHKVELSKK